MALATVGGETDFDALASFTLAAEAQDPDGSVASVEFYSGPTKLGQSLAPPFMLTRSNLAAGQYSFTAVAMDNTGLMSDAPVTISFWSPEPVGHGSGLIGEYYTNQNLTGLVLTRIDPMVNFSWGLGTPAPQMPADRFSVRWAGKLQARHAGTHQFHTLSDEGIRLWVDGQLLIDHWTPHSMVEDTKPLALRPGQYYDIRIEYFDVASNAVARLSWTPPAGVKEVIPQAQLYTTDVGLRGSYFSGTNLANLIFTRRMTR